MAYTIRCRGKLRFQRYKNLKIDKNGVTIVVSVTDDIALDNYTACSFFLYNICCFNKI